MLETTLTVQAPPQEVRELLRNELSEEDYALLSIEDPADDPFRVTPSRDIGQVLTVVEFAASAIAGGVLYDVVKRTFEILKERYGGGVERSDDDEPSAED